MDEQVFRSLARDCLSSVEDWAEAIEPEEMDFEPSDGVLKLEFPGGPTFVLNRQAGNSQMWLAAGVRAFHYDWDPASHTWRDDRDGHLLFEKIREVVSEQLGHEVPEFA